MIAECKEDIEQDVVISNRNKREVKDEDGKQKMRTNTVINHSDDRVCIEYDGTIRHQGEAWIHENTKSNLRRCATCVCKVGILSKNNHECILSTAH